MKIGCASASKGDPAAHMSPGSEIGLLGRGWRRIRLGMRTWDPRREVCYCVARYGFRAVTAGLDATR
jgi:hypothetical protein